MNKRTKEFRAMKIQPDSTDPQSRYARQKVCVSKATGEQFFGCWIPPLIKPSLGDKLYKVPVNRRTNLPLISYKFFGTTKLDWLIHEASKFMPGVPSYMMHPMDEGAELVIPDRTTVANLLAGLLGDPA